MVIVLQVFSHSSKLDLLLLLNISHMLFATAKAIVAAPSSNTAVETTAETIMVAHFDDDTKPRAISMPHR